jgi:hypothetical protein
MVPSWTEMLVSLSIEVIGRTRYCIEPKDKVKTIPIVGGTKDWDLKLIQSLKPDLIILDQDENPKSMSEGHLIPFVATHVRNIQTSIDGIAAIADAIGTQDTVARVKFDLVLKRWEKIVSTPPNDLKSINWEKMPGLIEWINTPKQEIESIYYVIWKNPWMVATKETFIGDVARMCGLPLSNSATSVHYPEIDLSLLEPKSTLLLFSSEPFPFHKKVSELKTLPFASAIVDGQAFSWFGTHSLRFLEKMD